MKRRTNRAEKFVGLLAAVGLLIASCATPAKEQADSGSLYTKTPLIQQLALDPLGQLYTVDARNTVRQYRADGSPGFRYDNNTLGRLSHIDPTNPFSILLFYQDFQTAILLDRTLNEKTRLVLSSLNLLNIELLALSNDNYLWLYDAVDFQLKKITADGQVLLSSDNLSLLLKYDPRPEQLLAVHNRILMNDPQRGVLIFDQFGRYDTTLPVFGAAALQMVDERTLVYTRDGSLYTYDLAALQERPVDWAIDCVSDCQFRVGKEQIYWLVDGQVQQMALPRK